MQNCPNPFQGRPQYLEPVIWEDGWPIIGKDVDGDGIGEPVRGARKPIAGHPVGAPQTDDDFNSETLGPQWEWNHNPRDDRWSLTERPGWLRLKASVPVGKKDFWGACNTISQRIMGTGKGRAEAKLDLAMDNVDGGQVDIEEEVKNLQANETLRAFEMEMGLGGDVSAPPEAPEAAEKTLGERETA